MWLWLWQNEVPYHTKINNGNSITLDMGRSNNREYFPGPEKTIKTGGPDTFGYCWARSRLVIADRVVCQWHLCQTQEWAFPAPRDKMVKKCPQTIVKCMTLSGPNWHLPYAVARTRSTATAAIDLRHTLKGVQGGDQNWDTLHWEKPVEQACREILSGEDFMCPNSCILSYLEKH